MEDNDATVDRLLFGIARNLDGCSPDRVTIEVWQDGLNWVSSNGLEFRARVTTPTKWRQAFGADTSKAKRVLLDLLAGEARCMAPGLSLRGESLMTWVKLYDEGR